MRPLGIAVAFLGLVAAGVVVLAVRGPAPPEAQQVETDAPQAAAVAVPQQPEAPATRTTQPTGDRVRPVAPDVVAAPPVERETLERVEARQPLSPIGRALAPSEEPPKPTILYRPLAVAAGRFESQGHTVTIAGIEPPDAGENCVSDGVSWPCGIHARTAFRNWLRGRALTCVVPPVPGHEVVVSDCTLGKQNPAEWLVTQGWARAETDGPYAALEEAARAQRRGLFGSAPAAPAPVTITLPDLSAPDTPASGG